MDKWIEKNHIKDVKIGEVFKLKPTYLEDNYLTKVPIWYEEEKEYEVVYTTGNDKCGVVVSQTELRPDGMTKEIYLKNTDVLFISTAWEREQRLKQILE